MAHRQTYVGILWNGGTCHTTQVMVDKEWEEEIYIIILINNVWLLDEGPKCIIRHSGNEHF